nr:hypothetical protein [Brucella anthropi]
MNGVGLAVMDCDNIDAEKLEPLIDCGHVFLIARNAIKGFDYDGIELPVLRVIEQTKKAVTLKH